jgi:hypothetical protein
MEREWLSERSRVPERENGAHALSHTRSRPSAQLVAPLSVQPYRRRSLGRGAECLRARPALSITSLLTHVAREVAFAGRAPFALDKGPDPGFEGGGGCRVGVATPLTGGGLHWSRGEGVGGVGRARVPLQNGARERV